MIHRAAPFFQNSIHYNANVQSDLTVKGKIKGYKDDPINVEGILIKDGTIEIQENLKEVIIEGLYVPPHKREDEKIELEEPAITFNSPVHFTKKVRGIETIKPISQCLACLSENILGLEWDTGTVCMQCVLDVAIHFQGKLSWEEQHGDPFKNCMAVISECVDEMSKLKKTIVELKDRIIELESHPKVTYAEVVNM